MPRLQHWLDHVLTYPARALMRLLASQRPRRRYDGIGLIVADEGFTRHAEPFFERTASALRLAASAAPRAFAEFRHDVEQVSLWGEPGAPAYNRFLRAVIVAPPIALEADIDCYAAWLLRASAPESEQGAARVNEFLATRDSDRRSQLENWLRRIR